MKRRWSLIALSCAAAFLLVALALSLARRPGRQGPARYELTFLPSLGGFRTDPHSINDRGQIVGVAETPTNAFTMFLWDREQGFRNLGPFDNPHHMGGLYINNIGQIAGTITDPNGNHTAFLWDLSADKHLLGALGGKRSMAYALNDKGQVAGYAETPARIRHAFLWDAAGGMRDLGTLGGPESAALSMNEAGQVVGFAETADQRRHAVLWDPADGAIDLGYAGVGPFACRINNHGLVVYRFGTVTGKTYFKTWTPATGLRELDFVAVDSGMPCGLNEAGQLLIQGKPTGPRLFGRFLRRRHEGYLWDPDRGALLLEDYLPVQDIHHFLVVELNDSGAIIGRLRTKDSGQMRAVLLEPVAPSTGR